MSTVADSEVESAERPTGSSSAGEGARANGEGPATRESTVRARQATLQYLRGHLGVVEGILAKRVAVMADVSFSTALKAIAELSRAGTIVPLTRDERCFYALADPGLELGSEPAGVSSPRRPAFRRTRAAFGFTGRMGRSVGVAVRTTGRGARRAPLALVGAGAGAATYRRTRRLPAVLLSGVRRDHAESASPRSTSFRGRAWRAAPWLALVAGLLLVIEAGLTVFWKEPFTSLEAAQAQGTLKDDLNQLQSAMQPALTRVAKRAGGLGLGALVDREAATLNQRVPDTKAVGRLQIPKLHLNYVVVQGTDAPSLEKGPAHYTQTPLPGARGHWTVGIAGHRTTYLAPFRHVDDLRPGDPITVTMPYGVYSYSVSKTVIVDAGDTGIFRPVGYNRLALTACHPLYSAAQRIVVYARLRHVALRGAARRLERSLKPPRPAPADSKGWSRFDPLRVLAALVKPSVRSVARVRAHPRRHVPRPKPKPVSAASPPVTGSGTGTSGSERYGSGATGSGRYGSGGSGSGSTGSGSGGHYGSGSGYRGSGSSGSGYRGSGTGTGGYRRYGSGLSGSGYRGSGTGTGGYRRYGSSGTR